MKIIWEPVYWIITWSQTHNDDDDEEDDKEDDDVGDADGYDDAGGFLTSSPMLTSFFALSTSTEKASTTPSILSSCSFTWTIMMIMIIKDKVKSP